MVRRAAPEFQRKNGHPREARSIEIQWPSGRVQALGPIACDRILRIEEPRQAQ